MPNEKGEEVPVLYTPTGVDMDFDTYYYVGAETIGGILCDKWRKIELVYPQGDTFATWDSDYKAFAYTN
jgi:hypothetical protein